MMKPQSHNKIEIKVNEQMEKFLLRSNTSQRQMLSKISSKIVNDEIVFIQKFTRPKKIIIPEFKSSIILNGEASQRKSLPEPIQEQKFSRSIAPKLTSSPRLAKPLELFYSTVTSPAQSPNEELLDKYSKLFKCTSISPKRKKLNLRRTKKTIKNLCRNIKHIGKETLSEKVKEQIEVKMFAKNHEKKYLQEAIKEMNDMKVANAMADVRLLRYTSYNSGNR